jgi:hypothetical protein
MSRRKTPDRSTLKRGETIAYLRKDAMTKDAAKDAAKDVKDTKDVVKDTRDVKDASAIKDVNVKDASAVKDANTVKDLPPAPAMPFDVSDGAPEPMKANEQTQPTRGRVDTIGMPAELIVGLPPEMPTPVAAVPPRASTEVEHPTHMPGPRDVPGGKPDDRAPPPGLVPPGDSRSMRRGTDFALIYRLGNAVISRFGIVGTRGQWRVVEYPTVASASHAYAKECSRFVSEGFSDYRE